MTSDHVNPFLNSMTTILPQLGFNNVEKGKIWVNNDNKTISLGVMTVVGLTGQIYGNIIYNMTKETAMKLASTMMFGIPITELDPMAESVISEMSNMLVARASILLEEQLIKVDISPPTLMVGTGYTATSTKNKWVVIEVLVDSLPIEVNISID